VTPEHRVHVVSAWCAGTCSASRPIPRVDGVELYTSLGFRERAHPTMRLGLSAPTETFL